MSAHGALAAVDAIIDDFAHHRRDAYFAGFAEDATFVFHTGRGRLDTRAAYEAEWLRWERDEGFQVLACRSSGRRLQEVGDDVAIFTHDVDTDLADGDGSITLHERETIVLQRRGDRWLCVHEHLSGRDA
jgi:ketosteroid isomerase-like protein